MRILIKLSPWRLTMMEIQLDCRCFLMKYGYCAICRLKNGYNQALEKEKNKQFVKHYRNLLLTLSKTNPKYPKEVTIYFWLPVPNEISYEPVFFYANPLLLIEDNNLESTKIVRWEEMEQVTLGLLENQAQQDKIMNIWKDENGSK